MDFNFFPEEIVLEILSRLPADTAIACKSVCTSWKNLVSNHPLFSKMHLQHLNHPFTDSGKLSFIALSYELNFDEVGDPDRDEEFHYFEYNENHGTPSIERITRINLTSPFEANNVVGSCNGLICLSSEDWMPIACICNPITREYVELPLISTDSDVHDCIGSEIAFGYVSSTSEYKVVAIDAYEEYVEIHIYTLGSGHGWRNLGKFSYNFVDPYEWRQPISDNGALYWIDSRIPRIVIFDLAEEKFCKHLSLPPLPPGHDWRDDIIGVLDGFLFFAVKLVVEGAKNYDIWLLKKKNANHDMKEQPAEHQTMVWNKEFTIGESKWLVVTKTGAVLTCMKNHLNIYDTKALTSKLLVDFKEHIFDVLPHKNTLISLRQLGEEDTKTMESVEELESFDGPFKQLQEDAHPEDMLINWTVLKGSKILIICFCSVHLNS